MEKKAKLNTQILPLKNSGPFKKTKYTEKKKNDTRQCQYRVVIPPWAMYGQGGFKGYLNSKDD